MRIHLGHSLSALRPCTGVTHAIQRLPDCVALWLAESAAALTVASSQGHRHAAKALLSTVSVGVLHLLHKRVS